MRKLIILLAFIGIGAAASAQTTNPFPTTDSLRKFINKWIRNSAVDAFTNLRLNTALIGMSRFIDSVDASGSVQYSDTVAMLAGYLRKGDTASMLSGYVRLTRFTDSIAALRAAINTGTGYRFSMVSDVPTLGQIRIYSPAKGVASSANVANYSHTSVDSARYKFSSSGVGTEFGGWLVNSTSGDSIRVTVPFWVVFGDSQAEGHRGRHGRLDPLVGGVPQSTFIWNYPDSAGQISYHLAQLMRMRVFNQGIGGQTTVQCRRRFYRDVVGKVSLNSTDGRSNQTLTGKPQGAVIIVGINDIFNGIADSVTRENIEWMAAVCQAEGIRAVFLNMPGDEIATQTELRKIAALNKWFASGVLDQYGAVVVDYNSWWNDPAYGNDNVHPTALIDDDIHPTLVGYDSLANYIFRSAKLPVLRKAVFINELSPDGFSGYSRPANITINGVAHTISSANDTINITTYVPDSVWIKTVTSTNVTGTTYSGFSHIEWFVDNNPNNDTLYTRKTLYSGSYKPEPSNSRLTLIAPTLENNYNLIDAYLGDITNHALQLRTGAGGTMMILNGLASTSVLNNSTLTIHGGGTAIGTAGSIISTATNSQFGDIQIQSNGTPTTTGYGISSANTSSSFRHATTALAGRDQFRFDAWNGSNATLGSNATNLLSITNIGLGSATGVNQVGNAISITPTYNQASGVNNARFSGIYYKPILTSLTNTPHFGLFMVSGNNYLNIGSDSTCIGCDSTENVLAKFRIKGSFRLDGTRIGTSTMKLLVKGTDSLTYQIDPTSVTPSLTTNYIGVGSSNLLSGSSAYQYNGTSVLQENSGAIHSITSTTTLGSGSGGVFNLYAKDLPTAANQQLGVINFGSRNGSTADNVGVRFRALTNGAWTDGSAEQAYAIMETNATGTLNEVMRWTANGRVSIGNIANPNSRLQIAAGSTSLAPFTLTSGTDLTTPLAGAFEYDGTRYKLTNSSNIRRAIVTAYDATPSAGTIPISNGTEYTNEQIFFMGSVTTTSTVTLSPSVKMHTIIASAPGGNVTITVTANHVGQVVNVKRIDSPTNTITVQGSAGNIDGAASVNVTTQYQNIQMQWDGFNWHVL